MVVVGVVAALAWGVLASWLLERAESTVPPVTEASAAARHAPRAPATCHLPGGTPCYEWAKRKARAVREGRMRLSPRGHSHLTRHTKHLIHRWFLNHPRVMAREMAEDGYCLRCRVARGRVVGGAPGWCFFCDLYPDPENLGRCLTYLAVHPSACTAESERVEEAQEDLTRVTVICGGGALIAYRIGGAVEAAIGSGVTNCYWAHWASAIWGH